MPNHLIHFDLSAQLYFVNIRPQIGEILVKSKLTQVSECKRVAGKPFRAVSGTSGVKMELLFPK
jgi:hypothetical protein